MKKKQVRATMGKVILLLALLVRHVAIVAYAEPAVNLGFTNILDASPIRPDPGWYWITYVQYYQAHKFLNNTGGPLYDVPSKTENSAIITQLLYQFPLDIFNGNPGLGIVVPAVTSLSISPREIGTSSGSGLGDIQVGPFWQSRYTTHKGHNIFIHHLELDVSIPTGKYKEPFKTTNAGNGFYFVQPFWAACFYFTQHVAASWRLNYLWNGIDKKTGIQAGQAIFGNYDVDFEIIPKLWVAANGYFFNQFTDNKLKGVNVPESRESVVGIGPGVSYVVNDYCYLYANAYFEMGAKNRTEGFRLIFRFYKQF